MMVKLRLEEISDPATRENFQKLDNEFASNPIIKGRWRFIEMTFLGAVTNFKYPHGLGFTPKDKFELSVNGAGTVTWHYPSFDRTNIQVSTTGACVVRALIGKVSET